MIEEKKVCYIDCIVERFEREGRFISSMSHLLNLEAPLTMGRDKGG